ncbi:hypothetical protein TNCV_4706361 [Trichonephila clavipes]|nr:hypothetical protein TNCV_4706361 [Trichonephila clavipes]
MATPPISTSTILPWDWRGEYSPVPCTRDSAYKTFGPTDLTSTYSVCTRRVFGGIEPRPSGLESDAQATHGPLMKTCNISYDVQIHTLRSTCENSVKE